MRNPEPSLSLSERKVQRLDGSWVMFFYFILRYSLALTKVRREKKWHSAYKLFHGALRKDLFIRQATLVKKSISMIEKGRNGGKS